MGVTSKLVRSRQHLLRYLTSLQVWQLKHLAINTGFSTKSSKVATAEGLLNGLEALQYGTPGRKPLYKSVDMGVKNLAFSVIEAGGDTASFTYKLLDWQRLNVLTADKLANAEDTDENAADEPDGDSSTTASLFSPSNLAPAATRLARRLADEFAPSHILIERQRYRSGRGAAVQEWTLRVNTLEAMLWASLQAMRDAAPAVQGAGQLPFPSTVEMSPQRIAAFWNARGKNWSLVPEEMDSLLPEKAAKSGGKADADDGGVKRGMEKAEKIALVRNWLENGDVDVTPSVQPLANAFMQTGRARRAQGDLVIRKKDDLADCVVQGVTFGLWHHSRKLLKEHLEGVVQ